MSAGSATRKNIRISLVLLIIFALVSTMGFYLLGVFHQTDRSFMDCLHYTASIFSTVGDMPRNGHPFTAGEKLWEILMIVFGIGVAVYAFGTIMAMITGGEIQRMLGRRQLFGKIRSLENHYIVCGFGRMGQGVAQSLARENQPFVVLERDAEKTTLADERDYLYLLGDATDESLLNLAALNRAKGLVACLPHDADNVFVTLTARQLNPEIQIIARAEQQGVESRLISAGATRTVCPPVIGAAKVTRMLLHPAVDDMLDATMQGDFAFDRINVDDLPNAVGQSLRDLALPREYGLMVLAVQTPNGSRQFNPPADHTLASGEQMIVIGQRENVDRLVESGLSDD